MFVLLHVVVPRLGVFEKLGFLGHLNVFDFFFVLQKHGVLLPQELAHQHFLVLASTLLRVLVVPLCLSLIPQLLQKLQIVDHLGVSL